MQIRRLLADDWEAHRDIRLEALADSPGNYFTSLAEARARGDDAWRAMLMGPSMAIFGLYDDTALIGLTGVYLDRDDPSGRTAGLAMSYIRPAWRGRGFSALFYAARLDWAREQGCTRMIVSHRASNTPSRRAVERHGFQRIGADRHRWPDGSEEDDVRYELML
jgi:RimJ/RimL family protein N-acetyltransferase